jgi:quercetin dioxygenase-like cupin family protein
METIYIQDVRERAAFSPAGPRQDVLLDSDHMKSLIAGIEPGQRIPVHPEGLSVYYFVEGTGWMTVDGERYAVGPGTVLVLPNGAARGLEVDTRLIFVATRLAQTK